MIYGNKYYFKLIFNYLISSKALNSLKEEISYIQLPLNLKKYLYFNFIIKTVRFTKDFNSLNTDTSSILFLLISN